MRIMDASFSLCNEKANFKANLLIPPFFFLNLILVCFTSALHGAF